MTRTPRPSPASPPTAQSASATLEEFVSKLERPRTAWVMLPAGHITEKTIETIAGLMQAGDVIIDGGNTFWQDDVRRGNALKARGIHYVDVGTSGGVWGLDRGYCMMIGGERPVVDRLDPIFAALAPGAGDIPRTEGREGRDPAHRAGLHPCGPGRRRPFRQDDPQRHRIRPDAGLCRRFRHLKNANIEALPADHRFDFELPTSPRCGGAAA